VTIWPAELIEGTVKKVGAGTELVAHTTEAFYRVPGAQRHMKSQRH